MSFNVGSHNRNYSTSEVFFKENTGPWHQLIMVEQTLMYSTWYFCYKTLFSDISESPRNNITTVICWCFSNMIPAFTTLSTFLYYKQDVIWWCSTHSHSCTLWTIIQLEWFSIETPCLCCIYLQSRDSQVKCFFGKVCDI